MLDELREAILAARTPEEVVEVLARVPHYTWVGIYWIKEGKLVLGPWRGPGPTVHTEIEPGVGLCGAAVQEKRTILAPDVREDPRYLACFPETRSEIVVPIITDGEVLGEIDIDSYETNAFGQEDVRFLEWVARRLGEMADGG